MCLILENLPTKWRGIFGGFILAANVNLLLQSNHSLLNLFEFYIVFSLSLAIKHTLTQTPTCLFHSLSFNLSFFTCVLILSNFCQVQVTLDLNKKVFIQKLFSGVWQLRGGPSLLVENLNVSHLMPAKTGIKLLYWHEEAPKSALKNDKVKMMLKGNCFNKQ